MSNLLKDWLNSPSKSDSSARSAMASCNSLSTSWCTCSLDPRLPPLGWWPWPPTWLANRGDSSKLLAEPASIKTWKCSVDKYFLYNFLTSLRLSPTLVFESRWFGKRKAWHRTMTYRHRSVLDGRPNVDGTRCFGSVCIYGVNVDWLDLVTKNIVFEIVFWLKPLV